MMVIQNYIPTMADLSPFDVAFVYTDGGMGINMTSLGNVLADYVDQGGHLIMTTFLFDSSQSSLAIAGRILTDGYLPFQMSASAYDSNTYSGGSTRSVVANVTSFSNGST